MNIRPQIDEASRKIHEVQERAAQATREAAHAVDRDAHERPWFYAGIIAAIAVVLGFLVGRGSRR